ncbi:FtsX-like permease family protein [Rhodocytophaga rosea]|uniref:FtsX-like permease family protein n=1 Tax=Rhodocytophaga rosea TaxID=2704465 RepID=A0A6C0GS62_9BACT|nr:ABC transporter permease [Rhodocytophaga rosea]QHT70443.1 FtsX-like permease family protein [Rhodocytophaga rosea]
MLRNYITVAIRSVLKDKFYSFINVLGLTIGITCSLLLLLYVTDELSYDKYHTKANKIYRVVSQIQEPDKSFGWAVTQPSLGPALKQDYPVVENVVRFFPYGRVAFQQGEKQFFEENIYAADSTVFDVFTYNFIEGTPATALDAPNSMVLTQSTAKKFFGNTSALGQTLQTNDTTVYKVTGVIEDVPKNSHFTFNALLSLGRSERTNINWGGFYVSTYVELPENYNSKDLEAKFPQIYDKYVKEIFGRMGIKINYELQPIERVHLYSKLEGETNGDIGYIYTFSAIAFFMLLIASINYMNLATARSAKRAKEVGIRKVLGSLKSTLRAQFLTESLLMTLLALAMSFILVLALLPFFNTVADKEIQFSYLLQPQFLLLALGIVIFTGIISGSYPAFYLSSFEPAAVLKGALTTKGGNVLFRKILVVMQFSISLIMLICTWVVFEQLNYMREKDLGYDKQQVLTIAFGQGQSRSSYTAFRNTLLANPKIKNVATASSPTSNIGGRVIFAVETNAGVKELAFRPMGIDHDYIKALGMKIIQGRDFSADVPADTTYGVLINEATVKRMNWKEPLGKKMHIGGIPQDGQPAPPMASVVGVVKDFHQQSLYSPIEPLIMLYRPNNGVVHIKVEAQDIPQTLGFIENTWKQMYPKELFEYNFLDQDFESAYHADELRGRIFTAFSTLTILIACLGLFGLATFTTEQRVKEIGVRKVLGASVWGIVLLLSKDFTKLVLLSFPIAIPVAYFSMRSWLENFPYQTTMGAGIFISACLLTLFICWLTVMYQSIKAALANPAISLRSE